MLKISIRAGIILTHRMTISCSLLYRDFGFLEPAGTSCLEREEDRIAHSCAHIQLLVTVRFFYYVIRDSGVAQDGSLPTS